MKKIFKFLGLVILLSNFSLNTTEASQPIPKQFYVATISFDLNTLPDGITITEIKNYRNLDRFYKINNTNKTPFYIFRQSSYFKDVVVENTKKITSSLPACSSEIETKTEIGCLDLIDGGNYDGLIPLQDNATQFDKKLAKIPSVYSEDPAILNMVLPFKVFGLYNEKLIEINGNIKFEKYEQKRNSFVNFFFWIKSLFK